MAALPSRRALWYDASTYSGVLSGAGMTLRRKILLTFVVATATLLIALYLVLSATVRGRLWEVEQAECRRDVGRGPTLLY